MTNSPTLPDPSLNTTHALILSEEWRNEQTKSEVRIGKVHIDLAMEAGCDAGGWMENWGSNAVISEGANNLKMKGLKPLLENLVSVDTKVLSEGARTWG